MEESRFNEIWWAIKEESYDRQKGSFKAFKRALWYGGRGRGNFITNVLGGGGKGLRKVLRNAPKNIVTKILPGAATAPLALIPGAHLMASKITEEAIKLSIKAARSLIVLGVHLAIEHGSDLGKKVYNNKFKPFSKEPLTLDESLRKAIKESVKEIKKGEAILIIDRNLVKMNDAKKEIQPAIKNLMSVMSEPFPSIQKNMEAAERTLRAVAETEYYIDKIAHMVYDLQCATNMIQEDIQDLKEHIVKTTEYLKEYMMKVID